MIADQLLALLYRLGLFGAHATPPEDVKLLIGELQPVGGEHRLIRVGPAGDGGYLIPDDLEDVSYCFSPGVADEAGFEAELASRGISVFLADASVDQPPIYLPEFAFWKKYVGALNDQNYFTLDSWKAEAIGSYDGDLILQMDIEGGEYEALLSTSRSLISQFRIMVIEFHNLHHLLEPSWFRVVDSVFRRLLKTHAVVHAHPNNCCGIIRARGIELPRVLEFTFHRRDRLGHTSAISEFPHTLDVDNTSKRPLILPEMWYKPKE